MVVQEVLTIVAVQVPDVVLVAVLHPEPLVRNATRDLVRLGIAHGVDD